MRLIDLTGKKYGKLVVKEVVGRNKCGALVWQCECECGNKTKVYGHNLGTGRTKSCGCGRKNKLELPLYPEPKRENLNDIKA